MKYQNHMRSYISERRTFGFQLKCEERYLLKFAKFVDEKNITLLKPEHFLDWEKGLRESKPSNLESKT